MRHVWTIVLLLLVGIPACRTLAPIVDVVDQPLRAAPATATSGDVDEAIWRAGRKLGWRVEPGSAGSLRGVLRIRSHTAVVAITHDMRQFSIRYVDSTNLRHDGNRIHPNYNVWIERLAAQIRAEPIVPIEAGGD
jgi:hypothetical protein